MSKIKSIIVLCVFFLFTAFCYAADYTIHKLPNGQTLIVYEIHNNPIVTIDTWIRTGSINENDSNNGISHFLEHLFFKGTKNHPAGDADRILESKGAIVNAATSKDFTHYYITIPSEHFDTALDLHSDMLLNPQIPQDEMDKERKVVIEEISKDGNTPSRKAYENLNTLMYTNHPYKRKVIGTSENVSNMTREDVLGYFNKFYAPSNMVTLVVGDVDTNKTIQKVQKAFNQKYKKPVRLSFTKEQQLNRQKRNTEYYDTQSGYIMIGFRGVNISDEDSYALDVLSEILGGGKTSRFYKDIKEEKNLAFSISSSNVNFRDDGIIMISANFIPENQTKLEKAIFEEIKNIQAYGITDEELNLAKKKIIQDTYYSRESTSDIASELGYINVLAGNSCLYDSYVSKIQNVSRQDVQNAAKKYLGQQKSAVSVVLPENMKNHKQEISKTDSQITKISEKSGIEKYMSDNGATILINKNRNNDIVAISIISKGGEFIEKVPGEGTLTAKTMLKGTKNYSSQELASLMDENGIKISVDCDSDFFVISVQTTIAQLDKTIEILDEIINRSSFNDSEIEKTRTEILSRIKQKRDVPMNVALEEFKTLIYEGSVYSQTNKVLEKTLPSVTRKNITDYYNRIFDSKNIIVSVNGNVNSESISKQLGNIFSNRNYPKFDFKNYSVTKQTSPKKVTKNIKDLQTSWLFLGWQTPGVTDKKDFVTLKVINTLLGSGLSSRLYRNLRESQGLAYQLGTSYSPKMLGGTFMGYIGTNPETLEYSREKMLDEINRLKSEFVTDRELQDAKDRLKGGFIIALETNSEKAQNIGIFESYGFGYDFLESYIKMINEVTPSDVLNTANKYFNYNIIQSDVRP